MPVRIYEIAKKLGVDSKFVIVKAKELGVAGARVPSSTLDKITAEYLLEQLGYHPETPVAEAVAPVATPPSVGAPTEVLAAPPAVEPVAAVGHTVPESAVSPVVVVPSEVVEPPPIPPVSFAPPAEVVEPVPPVGQPSQPTPPAEPPAPASTPAVVTAPPPAAPVAPAAAPVVAPHSHPAVTVVLPPPEVQVTPAPVTPPPPPALPSEPYKPKLGEKVGFIVLPNRPRPPERPAERPPVRPAGTGVAGAPARPEPPRGRDTRFSQPASRPATSSQRAGFVGMGRVVPGARPSPGAQPDVMSGEELILRPPISVRDLAEALKRKPFQIIADLMEFGIFANVNQSLEPEVAQRVAAKHGIRLRVSKRGGGEGPVMPKPEPKKEVIDPEDKPEDLKPRAPVVTIMGHVDHGKTTLLDVIRQTNVAAGEAGGITQHIGAYTISVPHPERKGQMQQITFLDTPGHAAFSAMRARGAHVTDVVILVVAANDGVMPQTMEALEHAQAAKVPIIVAVNKCDHPAANSMRVRQQLQEKGLIPDEWGGNTFFVDVSAITKQGVDKLLEMICFQADLLDLKANPNRHAKGNVVESGIEPGGPTATVLVRKGTLRVADVILCGQHYGRVRALINEEGQRLKEAGPSVAVRVLGLNGVPEAGVEFMAVENERRARDLAEESRQAYKAEEKPDKRPGMTLEGLYNALEAESAKVLRVVVKADTNGSVEAIVDALKGIKSEKVSLEVIRGAVGTITQEDITLASASKAVVLGFHARVDNMAADLAKQAGVQIKLYAIIYELIDQVRDAMAGLLDPLLKEVVFGTAEVRKIFELSKGGNVAGCAVTNGRIVRGKARVVRRRNVIYEGLINTLRRFQDEVNEVRSGMECGVRLDGFNDFQEGDVIECCSIEKVAQKL